MIISSKPIFLLILACSLLSACATVPTGSGTGQESATSADQLETSSQEASMITEAGSQESAEEIVYGNFPEELLSKLILTELAGQRGMNDEALQGYVELAEETRDLAIIKRATRIASFMRDFPATVAMAELWLEQEPQSREAHQMMALQMLTNSRYRQAIDHFKQLQSMGVDMDFRLISTRIAADDEAALFLDALIEEFLELGEQFPSSVSIKLALTSLYQQNGQYEQALQQVSKLTESEAETPDYVLLRVQLLEQMGNEAEARELLRDSLENHSNSKEIRFLYARKLIEEQNYRAALQQLEIIVEQSPDDFDILYSLALLNLELQRINEAKRNLLKLVENGQKLDDAHYYLGYIYAQENNPAQALEQYLQVNGGNNYIQTQRYITEIMVRQGRYQEASARLQGIRFRNPEFNLDLLALEGNVLLDAGMYEAASRHLNSAVGAFPNNIQLLFLRSVLSQEINDLSLMEQDLRKIIQLNPENPVAYNHLGYYLVDQTDRIDEAYALILKAVELSPDDPAIIDSLGWAQYRLGMYEEALANLKLAFELFPDHEVAAHLGEVLWVTGQQAEAQSVWNQALETQPNSEHVLGTMERLSAPTPR